MKVVLFCGGLGMRIRESPESIPKPMLPIGGRPILWHLMKYYAHHGIREFILCLGYRGDVIRGYLARLQEDWAIHCLDSGIETSIGERLRAAEPLLAGEESFFANYADGLTDLPLGDQLAHFRRLNRIATFLSVRPNLSYHSVVARPDGVVTEFHDIGQTGMRVNGGYFIFKREIFRFLRPGDDLVEQPFTRLIGARELVTHRYDGFWTAIDTAKDHQRVRELYASGNAPWMLWEKRTADQSA